jgi:uncharacterized hydrophobic protein (TIGR00271 family)
MVSAEPSCATVVVNPGAARRPVSGDLVQCEVGRDAVDELVEAIAEVPGAVVSYSDTTLLLAEQGSRASRGDAVVWTQVSDMLERNSRFSVLYVMMISIAGAIAAVGILEDLFLLVIAAMALSPDYFPLIAGSLALVRRHRTDFLRSLAVLASGFATAAIAAWLLTEALMRSGVVRYSLFDPDKAVALFVDRPNWVSAVVACLAGVAGALSVTILDNRALVGVFVSITTIPAAAGIGVALALGSWGDLGGAAGQLGINVACLYVTGAVTLWVQRIYWARRAPGVAHPLDRYVPSSQDQPST